MKLELSPALQQAWKGKDPFDELDQIEGTVYKQKDNRCVTRFELGGMVYFAKVHHGVGWNEVFKNLVTLKKPVLSAANEWEGIRKFEQLGVPTLKAEGFGVRGANPAMLDSFLVTRELTGTVTLEALVDTWKKNPPDFILKKALIEELARISRILHENGVNHRDYYLCHFLLDVSRGVDALDPDHLLIYVVDLHRVQIRRGRAPGRWVVKDLAALLYSSLHAGITRRDVYRFIKVYSDMPLRQALANQGNLYRTIWQRARGFHMEGYGKPAPELF